MLTQLQEIELVPIPTPLQPTANDSGDQSQILYRRPAASVELPKSEDVNMFALEANPDNFPDGGMKAYLVLLGSFCGLIADFGIPNSLGAIEAYVSTHQLSNDKQSTVSWVFSLHLGLMFFCGVFSGSLFDRYGSRKLLIAGTVCMGGGLFASAQLHTLLQFILSFSILTAVGASLAMAPLIGVLSHWFLKKRGFACSAATIGGLVGASVFAVMLQDLYTSIGFKWAMRILAFICVGCMLLSILLIKDGPGRNVIDETELATETTNDERKHKWWLWEWLTSFIDFHLFKDIRFISLILAVFLSEMVAMNVLTYLASYALANSVSELKSYLLITIVNLSGIPARFITGILADKYGRFNIMLFTSVFSAVFIFSMLLPAKGNLLTLYAFCVAYGCSSSAVLSLIAPCLGQICSATSFGKYYGTLYFCLAFMIIFGIYLASLTIDNGTVDDYNHWIIFEGSIAFAAVFAWIWARSTNVGFRLCKF